VPVLLQVRWLARLSDPAVRFVDKIIGEAVVSAGLRGDWVLTSLGVVCCLACTVTSCVHCDGPQLIERKISEVSKNHSKTIRKFEVSKKHSFFIFI
jgi:hypothetical protein